MDNLSRVLRVFKILLHLSGIISIVCSIIIWSTFYGNINDCIGKLRYDNSVLTNIVAPIVLDGECLSIINKYNIDKDDEENNNKIEYLEEYRNIGVVNMTLISIDLLESEGFDSCISFIQSNDKIFLVDGISSIICFIAVCYAVLCSIILILYLLRKMIDKKRQPIK